MIVCHCEVVNDRAIAGAVAAGAQTVAQVCRATGAGSNCGSCVFAVKRLIPSCTTVPALTAQIPETARAAS